MGRKRSRQERVIESSAGGLLGGDDLMTMTVVLPPTRTTKPERRDAKRVRLDHRRAVRLVCRALDMPVHALRSRRWSVNAVVREQRQRCGRYDPRWQWRVPAGDGYELVYTTGRLPAVAGDGDDADDDEDQAGDGQGDQERLAPGDAVA